MTAQIDIIMLHRGWRWFRWRGLVLVLVFFLGLIAFCSGVQVSDRELAKTDFMTKIYYTLGLFVLGGLDLGVPVAGPVWARLMLWVAYFAAPAITTSALVEAVLRAIKPTSFRLRHIRNHIVIVGCGRLAMLYLERLRQSDPKTPVLIIDNRANNPHAQAAVQRFQASVLIADIASQSALQAVRLHHAQRLVVLTGDDYINLDTAASAIRIAPHLASQTLIHISDIRLLRVVEEIELLQQASKFNSYRRAAQYLVDEKLVPHFDKTKPGDIVVLAGFGRFGQSVLDELQQRAVGKFGQVIIIDQDGDLPTMVFDEQIGFRDNYEWQLYADDLQHPRTWQRVAEAIGALADEHAPVFILASGDDSVNIRTALWLSQKYPNTKILARCFRQSTFAKQMSGNGDFEVFSTYELLMTAMNPAWFEG